MSVLTESDLHVSELARTTRTLVVSEIFGPTFQGEGASIGRVCSFLRLGGCNLHCSWCDTPYTWDWTGRNGRKFDPRVELRRISIDDAFNDLESRGTDMIVISGGEPLLQQLALEPLVRKARLAGWWIELETAGTIAPTPEIASGVSRFNVSPKLANSDNSLAARCRPEAVTSLQATGKASWKFVVRETDELDEVQDLVDRFHLNPVYVMPEGVSASEIEKRSQDLAQSVLDRGWNLTTRLHVLVYGNRRGV